MVDRLVQKLREGCPSIPGMHIRTESGAEGEVTFPYEFPPTVRYKYLNRTYSPQELEGIAQERSIEVGQIHFEKGYGFLLDSNDPGTVRLDIFLDQFINEHPELVDDIRIIEHVHYEESSNNKRFSDNDRTKNEFMRKIMPNCTSRLIYKGKVTDTFP